MGFAAFVLQTFLIASNDLIKQRFNFRRNIFGSVYNKSDVMEKQLELL